MKYLLSLIALCLVLTGCHTARVATKPTVERSNPVAKVDTTVLRIPNSKDTTTLVLTTPTRSAAGKIISSITGRDRVKVNGRTGNIILPRKNKGSISINTGSGSATAAIVGKKAANGDGAAAINKPKEQVAVGDSIDQTNAEKKAIIGDGNTTQEAAGWKVYALWIAVIGGAGLLWLGIEKVSGFPFNFFNNRKKDA